MLTGSGRFGIDAFLRRRPETSPAVDR